MKYQIVIRKLTAGIFSLLFLSTSIFATAVVRSAHGGDVNAVIPAIQQFLADLGGGSHPDGGSYTTGYRFIDWDEVPENIAGGPIPLNFYNTTVQRGVVFSTSCSNDNLLVSATSASGLPRHFGGYNANYVNDFQEISGQRLLSAAPGGCNFFDIYFYVPGTKIPATVTGIGLVFMDVDLNLSTGIRFYGVDGQQVAADQTATASNNGLSFLGVSFNGGERIARVRVFLGTGILGDVDISRGGPWDVVVADLMMYGEPRAIGQHSSDFDGDGTSDYAVFRPANGSWYVMQSGSNTLAATQFGAAGDIPIDGDFDGDSRNDWTVFRPSTGAWYTLRTSNGQFQGTSFGLNGDRPVAGDYDKDGITDIAVWRPSNGNYYYLKSSNGQFAAAHFGANGDIPIGAAGL